MEYKQSHDVHQASTQQPKLYTCSFCKRGFSSAQALGGHMNIHRKDRAKLNESSKEIASPELGEEKKVTVEKVCEPKVKELYPFVETSSSQDFGDTKTQFNCDVEKNEHEIRGLSNSDSELDLELRLGLEYGER